MRSVDPDLITVLHSKIISAINLKLIGLDQLQHPAVTTGNPIPIILRDLLFSLYGLLRALCKLPTCSLDYNPENLYAFRIIQSGQL